MLIKQRPIPDTLPSLGNISPILQRIYASRGITSEAELDKQLKTLLPFDVLKDIDKACARLHIALEQQQRILIIGDFDADGATSTALAVTALKAMGASCVDYLVPNRFEFGYGLTPGIVGIASQWSPDLIITVDNGISSIEGVDAANALGIDVLVTDHHLPADDLPKACAIVNPNQHGDVFESKSIAGVGVIFYVMLALRRHLVNKAWFSKQGLPEPNMAHYLDLVALGTVADVVALDHNNRIMVNQGLSRIRQGLCRPGIKALIDISGRDGERLLASDLGFAIAPRLNAAGRLDDMSLGIECLICDNMTKARELAEQLNDLNHERRVIEAEMKEQAMLAVDKLIQKLEHNSHLPMALCLMDASWHQGVVGILAGRLKERYHRPVIAFSVVNDDELKGSARSVSALNIRDVLASIDKNHPGLMTKFGGHAMAAGLSLPLNHFNDFQQAFVAEVSTHLDISQCTGELLTDGALDYHDMTLDMANLLQKAGPWGQQFPEPCFDNLFDVLDQRLVGQHHLKLTLMHASGGDAIDAIAFNIDLNHWPNYRAKQVRAAYKLDINVYKGRSRLQLIIDALNVVT